MYMYYFQTPLYYSKDTTYSMVVYTRTYKLITGLLNNAETARHHHHHMAQVHKHRRCVCREAQYS